MADTPPLSPKSAHVIRKLIAGQAVNGHLNGLPDPWNQISQAVKAAPANPELRTRAFEAAIANLENSTEIRESVFAADLNADLEFLDQPHPPIDFVLEVPELPEHARLDPAIGKSASRWVDIYMDYARAISPMTPEIFHESAALALGSIAISRRLVLKMAFDTIFPNIFVSWIAPTTLYRKSTGLNIFRNIARTVFEFLLAAQDTTPEAFLSDLAGQQPQNYAQMPLLDQESWKNERDFAAQRGWILDEMSGLLAGAGKDYNAGLIEALLRFYDCDPSYTRSTKSQGRLAVRSSYLTLIGASTPAALAQHLVSERLWGMGWWPRFALLTPDSGRPKWLESRDVERPPELVDKLNYLFRNLPEARWPDPPRALDVNLGSGVFEAWSKYNKAVSYDLLTEDVDGRLWGTYGRLPTQVLKVATILASFDWSAGQTVRIELPHLARAQQIVESWRSSAHRAIELATATEVDRLQTRITYQIAKSEPDGISLRDLCRALRDKRPSEIEFTLGEMLTAGLVEEMDSTPGRQGGRPTKKFRLARG